MGKSASILIGERGGDHVLIEPEPKVTAAGHAASIGIRCGGFSAHYAGLFRVGELGKFGKDVGYLCENMKCTAALHAEDLLELMLTSDGHGRVHISGSARETPETKTRLEFEFDMDLVELRTASHALIAADRQ